jgi:fructose-1,6-bisphosphatase/inositol monophosphatase family enzyme
MSSALKVFLAHAHEDKPEVRPIYEKLKSAGFEPWLDERDLLPGQNWRTEIPKAIHACDIFLACLSEKAVTKRGYIQKELRIALVAYSERPADQIFIIPGKLDNCQIPKVELPELGIKFSDFQMLELWGPSWIDLFGGAVQLLMNPTHRPPRATGDSGPVLPLADWQRLERAVRDAAATAGFAAMGYYRNALAESTALSKKPNPSTMADEYATVAILQTLSTIDSLASDLGYQYRVFAEELDDPDIAPRILEKLQGNPVFSRIRTTTQDFRKGWEHSLSILIDSVDGTTNFDANIPFFCSAVAFFIEGRLALGAIYDPFHNQVFYGSLRRFPDGSSAPFANVWSIAAGNVEDLRQRQHRNTRRNLIATHIGRSNPSARRRLLKFLPFICDDKELNGGTYMLNSGQMALAHVASGNLGAFVNNRTNIWDVAAGEVLIRAVGGKVTDFNGRDIDYGQSTEISVLAALFPEFHAKLQTLIGDHYPWNEGDG